MTACFFNDFNMHCTRIGVSLNDQNRTYRMKSKKEKNENWIQYNMFSELLGTFVVNLLNMNPIKCLQRFKNKHG